MQSPSVRVHTASRNVAFEWMAFFVARVHVVKSSRAIGECSRAHNFAKCSFRVGGIFLGTRARCEKFSCNIVMEQGRCDRSLDCMVVALPLK